VFDYVRSVVHEAFGDNLGPRLLDRVFVIAGDMGLRERRTRELGLAPSDGLPVDRAKQSREDQIRVRLVKELLEHVGWANEAPRFGRPAMRIRIGVM
jgi:hypothetical protein